MKNVKCARCVKCGKEYEAVPNLTNCECGGILDIIYDYDYIKAHHHLSLAAGAMGRMSVGMSGQESGI